MQTSSSLKGPLEHKMWAFGGSVLGVVTLVLEFRDHPQYVHTWVKNIRTPCWTPFFYRATHICGPRVNPWPKADILPGDMGVLLTLCHVRLSDRVSGPTSAKTSFGSILIFDNPTPCCFRSQATALPSPADGQLPL